MMRAVIGFLFAVAALRPTQSTDYLPRVKTPLGGINGYYKISEYGRPYKAYEGIPYALPPVGKLRFEPPQPILPWIEELQATKMGHSCLQYTHLPVWQRTDRVSGAEDCLYLNIYVPEEVEDVKLFPVLIWIHGGAFTYGSGNFFGAKYLMNENVILVTINYRVGPLGFLSTEDDIIPGNMGLKDQSMAIEWIHNNIFFFGGDPEKITLVGSSAGAASVHYHYFSPLSANLFSNGISISGTALDCWTQAENPLEKAKKLGNLMGCPSERIHEMIDCLKSRPARSVVQTVKNFMPWLFNPFTPFGPVVEKATDKNPFITRSPIDMLSSGDVLDVPWITSVTSAEGLYPVAEFAAHEFVLNDLNENWETLAPHLLDFNYTIPQKLHAKTSMKIKEHYMGNDTINRENIKSIIKMVGDRLYVVDAEKAARMQAKANKSPVWFYYYSYRANASTSDDLSGTKEDFGVSHADDAYLVMENRLLDPTATQGDRTMKNDLVNMWTSFSLNGAPELTPHWKAVDSLAKEFSYLHISGPGMFRMANQTNFGEKDFWNTIKFNENIVSNIAKEEL